MGNPVVHFEIMGKDPKRLRKFYHEAFDWEIGEPMAGSPVEYSLVKQNGERDIGGGIGKAPEGYGGHVTFYVFVPDVAAALTKIESLGGKQMMGPDQVPGGPIIGLFEDPEGHVIGLVHDATVPNS
jgi:predicted enzyme related to lactoylglutathione lyase